MFTFSCAPSAGPAGAAAPPSSRASTWGEALTSTCSAPTAPSRSPSLNRTSARPPGPPSGVTPVTSCPVTSSAPARRAEAASASVTAPMPPTGTSQSPVLPPITWYRKQRFCRSDGSCAEAKVPIRPSVSTTPRTRSSANRSSIVTPSGCSNTACQVASSATRSRNAARVGSGSVSEGKTRAASRRVVA